MKTGNLTKLLIGAVAVLVVVYMINPQLLSGLLPVNNVQHEMPLHEEEMNLENYQNYESFENAPADESVVYIEQANKSQQPEFNVAPGEPVDDVEQPQGLQNTDSNQINQLPSECYPKDVLSSADLLPQSADSLYAQVNPSGQGSLQDQNFLTAGYHIGINTVGQTLRNANRQLRSEPTNPQVKVSPWMQTTIEPDINRKPLEIGGN